MITEFYQNTMFNLHKVDFERQLVGKACEELYAHHENTPYIISYGILPFALFIYFNQAFLLAHRIPVKGHTGQLARETGKLV